MVEETDDLDNLKPYLNEALWAEFYIYRAILGRTVKLLEDIGKGKSIREWREDDGIQSSLNAILSKNELKTLLTDKKPIIYEALNMIEHKILIEIDNILSGRQSSLEIFKNSKEILKLLSQNMIEFITR